MSEPPRQPRPPSAPPDDEGTLNPAWLVGSIVFAKIATLAIVLWVSWSPGTGLLVAVVSWYWLPILAALVAGPLLFARRLRRARRRRQELLRAEWMLDDQPVRPDSVSSPR